MDAITHGLVIREPYLTRILIGEKRWEMRSQATQRRGPIALIRKGTNRIAGVATLADCLPPVAPDAYAAYETEHAIRPSERGGAIEAGWLTPWVLADVRRLSPELPYGVRPGAVIWVALDDDARAALAAVLGDGTAVPEREAIKMAGMGEERPAFPSVPSPNVGAPPFAVKDGDQPTFVFRPERAQAYGHPEGREFVVHAGSTTMREGSPKVKRDRAERDRLVRAGVLVPDADPTLLRFAGDHRFGSASVAAGVVKDGNASGPQLWRHVTMGQTLRDWITERR